MLQVGHHRRLRQGQTRCSGRARDRPPGRPTIRGRRRPGTKLTCMIIRRRRRMSRCTTLPTRACLQPKPARSLGTRSSTGAATSGKIWLVPCSGLSEVASASTAASTSPSGPRITEKAPERCHCHYWQSCWALRRRRSGLLFYKIGTSPLKISSTVTAGSRPCCPAATAPPPCRLSTR